MHDIFNNNEDLDNEDLDQLITWCNDYNQQKECRNQLDKAFLSLAQHTSQHWDWCEPEDEKKEIEKLCKDEL